MHDRLHAQQFDGIPLALNLSFALGPGSLVLANDEDKHPRVMDPDLAACLEELLILLCFGQQEDVRRWPKADHVGVLMNQLFLNHWVPLSLRQIAVHEEAKTIMFKPVDFVVSVN